MLRMGMWACLAHLQGTGEMPTEKICSLFSIHVFLLHVVINWFDLILHLLGGEAPLPPYRMRSW